MDNKKKSYFEIAGAVIIAAALGLPGLAQQFVYKAPTPADWAALAKLPDFSGVWERGGGGGGQRANQGTAAPAATATRGNPAPTRGRGAAPQPGGGGGQRAGAAGGGGGRGGPSFTPEYEKMRLAATTATQPEDNSTANCLPPGMPGIMGQPYPMEFLLTPGKVTIIIE